MLIKKLVLSLCMLISLNVCGNDVLAINHNETEATENYVRKSTCPETCKCNPCTCTHPCKCGVDESKEAIE